MPVERSVLNSAIITDLVQTHYGVTPTAVSPIFGGAANCYRLSTNKADLFLKEFPAYFTEETVRREADISDFLRTRGFSTARFLRTKENAPCFSYFGHCIAAEEFLPGTTFSPSALPRKVLLDSAVWLGKLHRILADYPGVLPEFLQTGWREKYAPDNYLPKLDGFILNAEAHPNDPYSARILGELLFREQLCVQLEKYLPEFDNMTVCGTHGDYFCLQWLCHEEGIQSIIDFSAARRSPIAGELLRSYILSTMHGSTPALDVEDCVSYFRAYRNVAELTENDLALAPYFTLAEISYFNPPYSYNRYLNRPPEDDGKHIQLLFQRTEICMELHRKAASLSNALQKI